MDGHDDLLDLLLVVDESSDALVVIRNLHQYLVVGVFSQFQEIYAHPGHDGVILGTDDKDTTKGVGHPVNMDSIDGGRFVAHQFEHGAGNADILGIIRLTIFSKNGILSVGSTEAKTEKQG